MSGTPELEFHREAVPPVSEAEAAELQRLHRQRVLLCPKCTEHELRLVVRRYRPEGEAWKTVVGLVEACACGFQRPNERRLSCAMHDRVIDMMETRSWIRWAMDKQRTHTQVLCGECRRWRIWVPREDTP